jgi:hypothetical protein
VGNRILNRKERTEIILKEKEKTEEIEGEKEISKY